MPRDAKTGHLYPGVLSPRRNVPKHIKTPEYVGKSNPKSHTGSYVQTPEAITKIRAASRIAAAATNFVGSQIRPGMTTDELDALAHDFLISHDAYPSTLGYRGFPKSLCTSLNEVICHGIPDNTEILDGDIVNLDITAFKDGYHGDTNSTFLVGNVRPEVVELVERTKIALERGIAAALPGREVNIIGRTIEAYAKRFGYGVVRDFTGHGIGDTFHNGLIIPHYDSAPKYNDVIEVGMVFTIEPMLTLGTHTWDIWSDNWTVTTRDKSWTAQFEHTILITDQGPEILTLAEERNE